MGEERIPLKNHIELSLIRWKGINPGAIRYAATVFAALCVAEAARAENE